MANMMCRAASVLCLALFLSSCSRQPTVRARAAGDQSLVLALAVLGENDDGSPKPLPARLGILTRTNGKWTHRTLEDPDANVFHKAMAYGREGLLTFSGSKAAVKLWRTNGVREVLWEAEFGGQFNRMRDAEVGNIYGDGRLSIAVGTHDQGVVAILHPDSSGQFKLEELDRKPNTVVHEIELGDMDGDGVMEVYATPTAPNQLDGTPQPGKVVRYIPARHEGPTVVADLGDRHAKEILLADLDGDGRDELYVSVEAVSGGRVEIRRYLAATKPTEGELVATLDDTLCRFLTAGDVDGDGKKEVVAATSKSGLWLLRPGKAPWDKELIDANSSGFEHASILADLDGDGRDELYVASDDQREVRRYDWTPQGWRHEVLLKYDDKLSRFTWNIMAVPTALLPAGDVRMTDTRPANETRAAVASTQATRPAGDGAAAASPTPAPSVAQATATPNAAIQPATPAAVAASPPAPSPASAPSEPRGLRLNTGGVEPGYILYTPLLSDTTYLIDSNAVVVHAWKSDYSPSGTAYLLPNGNLLRGAREPNIPLFKGGGQGGRLQEFSWDGQLLWDWKFCNEQHLLHHDVAPMPNGHVLVIAWEAKTAQEANRVGRRPDLIPQGGIWPDMVLEVEPQPPNDARILWEWHMWDHLIQNYDPAKAGYGKPSEHPELIDINGDGQPVKVDPAELARLKALGYVPAGTKQSDLSSDLLHMNAVNYNAELDQIVVSTPKFNEIWIIDHSTITAQAAGHTGGRWNRGGDLLYRWGNPRAYSRGGTNEQTLFGQHDIRWIEKGLPGAGHLMVFDNNVPGANGPHSAVLEWAPPTQVNGAYVLPETGPFGPAQPDWKYEAGKSFHSGFISGARRLPGGNTLICSGADGRIFEVTNDGKIVWEFWDPYSGQVRLPDGSPPQPVGNATFAVFRATKIVPQHPALAGRTLQPLDPQPRPVSVATSK
jgi:hypothetical protein